MSNSNSIPACDTLVPLNGNYDAGSFGKCGKPSEFKCRKLKGWKHKDNDLYGPVHRCAEHAARYEQAEPI